MSREADALRLEISALRSQILDAHARIEKWSSLTDMLSLQVKELRASAEAQERSTASLAVAARVVTPDELPPHLRPELPTDAAPRPHTPRRWVPSIQSGDPMEVQLAESIAADKR